METPYNPVDIEQDAQRYWEEKQTFKASEDLSKEKFYTLCMFPYPSGNLHMGHVRNYTLGDVIARFQRMRGKNVLQPIGWDAFGLPAENAAIKHKVAPAKWTQQNIEQMRKQFKRLGFAYDWKRELATCDPNYYKWEQWFFIKLHEKGLVYKKNAMVNWDPVDKTVLANEQVIDGKGWRSGAVVERKEIPQWFIKITSYADELLDDLEKLTEWPEQVRTMQHNWIGRSEGVVIYFEVPSHGERLKVFTTRPDTLMGTSYVAIAPEHPLSKTVAEENTEVKTFLEECSNIQVSEAEIATIEKRGVDTGLTAVHPISGENVPIWVANFVLMEYGSGAVMSVPAHDQRDWEFAQKYHLPIQQVIKPSDKSEVNLEEAAFTDYGVTINSGEFDGMNFEQATATIAEWLEKNNKGKAKTHYRLRDWGVSRQRYWGCPIPMIYCPTCGTVPVPEDQLPVVLPEDVDFNGATSPLKTMPSFMEVSCPKCDGEATRETDTFDTFVESSWYYARFTCKGQDKAMLDDRAKYWTPVDYYIGGIEHAVMHLLYARFFHKLMRDEGLVNSDEPFTKLLTQGMVLKDGHKMSKSKGNTVDPQDLIDKYGADTVRLFTIFASPPEQSLEWSDSGVEGAYRFLKRVWAFPQQYSAIKKINDDYKEGIDAEYNWGDANDTQKDLRRDMYNILSQAQYDYERSQFNTVVSGCMKLMNLLHDIPQDSDDTIDQHLAHKGFSILLRLLAPITPHICHHLWFDLNYSENIAEARWPKIHKDALKVDQVEFVVQVNGKLRGNIKVASDADEKAIQEVALANVAIQKAIEGKSLKRCIVVSKRKIINLVVA